MMRVLVLLALPFMMMLMTPSAAAAEKCEPRVLHVRNVVQGSRVYSHWLIGHSPWRWATISFRYQITYIDEDDKEGKVEGRFSQLISGVEEEYVELKNLRSRPAQVTRTKFSDLTCEK